VKWFESRNKFGGSPHPASGLVDPSEDVVLGHAPIGFLLHVEVEAELGCRLRQLVQVVVKNHLFASFQGELEDAEEVLLQLREGQAWLFLVPTLGLHEGLEDGFQLLGDGPFTDEGQH